MVFLARDLADLWNCMQGANLAENMMTLRVKTETE
jgi:hypothetical protein